MKVIDLLNKIANGEEVPRKFTYKGYLWEYDIKNKMWFYYFGEGKNHRFDRLFYLNMCLNDEIEVIGEPKEELKEIELLRDDVHFLGVNLKVNEIIFKDKINELIENQNKIIKELKANK